MKIRTPRLAALSAALLITCDPAVRAANVVVRVQPGPISQTRAVPVTNAGLNGLAPLSAPASTLKLTGSVVPGAPALLSAPRVAAGVSAQAAAPAASAQAQAAQAVSAPQAQAQAFAAPAEAVAAPVAEAAATADAQAPVLRASSSKKVGVFTRLKEAILNKLDPSRMFDSSRGVAPGQVTNLTDSPLKTNLPAGIVLDDAPISPDPKANGGVAINAFGIPGAKDVGGIFEAGPVVLSADPASEASVKEALLKMVEADPAKYGVTRDELATVHVKLVQGVGNQADSIFAYFRQVKDGIPVHGAYLSFTVKVIQGQPVVMGAMARLYPNTPVETAARYSDDELAGRVWQRIGVPPSADMELTFIERKIIYSRGSWHTANLYMLEGLPVMIAVDVVTGEAFAWDPRMGATSTENGTEAGAGAQVLGRNVEKGPMKPTSKMVEVPLPNVNVSVNGKNYTTDSQGRINASVSKETQVTVTLNGKYVVVNDRAGKPLKVTATLRPGEEAKLVFNTGTTMDEELTAQVNSYFLINQLRDWLNANGISDARLDKAIPSNVNIDDECNAYYTPGRPSLNFFRSSSNCVNSAYDTVVSHEYGHFVDDMLGGIVDGGLSEGWGDILSMYILNNPIIGEGFLKKPRGGVDYIRHGENTRQYNQYDEVHDLGEVWGGFGWKLRKMLMASLGEAGDAVARSIVLPTLYAKAANIPAAMAQVLLNDVDKDGNIPHEKEIRAAAKIHGVVLPQNPGKLQQFVSWLTNPKAWFGRTTPDQKLTSRLKAASKKGAVDVVVNVKGGPKAVAAVSAYLLARGAQPKAIEGLGMVAVSGLTAEQVQGLAGLNEVRSVDAL